ncbi:HAD hydrolase-like protein [Rhizobium leguminosarum]|uniref:HAD hydrolase-like protein n=1 Tax=Rhizobium leguminosarum TaxID=384 RepID=UPI0021BC129D|nr:HAD hydrolase-like protein [Rhizobium leguminosarum]
MARDPGLAAALHRAGHPQLAGTATVELFPGTEELLSELSAQGVALAIVSSNSRVNIERALVHRPACLRTSNAAPLSSGRASGSDGYSARLADRQPMPSSLATR